MVSIKGTQTEKSLLATCAGASQARPAPAACPACKHPHQYFVAPDQAW